MNFLTTGGSGAATGVMVMEATNALSGEGTVNVSLGTGTATRIFNGDNSGCTVTLAGDTWIVGGEPSTLPPPANSNTPAPRQGFT